MTRYEQGFFTKCAEYGVDADIALVLLKEAGFFDSSYERDWQARLAQKKRLDDYARLHAPKPEGHGALRAADWDYARGGGISTPVKPKFSPIFSPEELAGASAKPPLWLRVQSAKKPSAVKRLVSLALAARRKG